MSETLVHAPVITFARESWSGETLSEVKQLLPMHWREMAQRQGDIPLDPNFVAYETLFKAGFATIFTARVDGKLVGYIIFIVTPRHMHYDHRWAKDDTIWIHPDHRNIGIATGLFDCFEADLKKDGPIVIQIETREGHEALELLLKARNYEPTGKLFGLRVT